ncbi:MAG: major capsid protein [Planctomycetota bacterium]
MAMTTIADLLGVDTLTGLVRTFAQQAEERTCTPFFEQNAARILPAGTSASWDEVTFSRHLAPVAGLDSPHTRAQRLKPKKRSSTMAVIKAYKDLPSSDLFLNRAPGQDVADAAAVLNNELEDLANLIANTREYLACGALLGRIEVNERTVPGSELEFTVDFQNRTLDAGASWADEATKIRSKELLALKRAYKDGAGMRAAIAITDPNVEGYLTQNKEVQTFARDALGVTILRNAELTGENLQWAGLGGLDWRFTDGTYQPEGGAVTRYFTPDRVVVLPAPARLRGVLGWAEGKVQVPAGPVFAGATGATSLVRELRGFYAYAKLRDDPVGIRIYAGWHGLPVVLNPRAILVYRTVPPAPTP